MAYAQASLAPVSAADRDPQNPATWARLAATRIARAAPAEKKSSIATADTPERLSEFNTKNAGRSTGVFYETRLSCFNGPSTSGCRMSSPGRRAGHRQATAGARRQVRALLQPARQAWLAVVPEPADGPAGSRAAARSWLSSPVQTTLCSLSRRWSRVRQPGQEQGSDPRRPTLRESLLRKPSDDPALAFADAVLDGSDVFVTATIGSLLEFDDAKLNDDGVPGRPWNGRMGRHGARCGSVGRNRIIGNIAVDRSFAFRQLRRKDRVHTAVDAGARTRGRGAARDQLRGLEFRPDAACRGRLRRFREKPDRPGTAQKH